MRLVKSRGLAFIPCANIVIALKQGTRASIIEVISHVFAGLGIQDCAYDPTLKWMQASFTAQANRTYTVHIRTYCEPQ